jgi:type II secretory pathway pseudopilin PulG
MFAARRPRRAALTLLEALVIGAIIAVLLALSLSGVQRVRESAHRARCQNNLRQLALAVQQFHEAKGTLPTYFGIYPAVQNNVTAEASPSAVFGGWFAHLLPYAGEGDLHRLIVEDVRAAQRNTAESRTVTTPATGRWVPPEPGTPDRWDPPRRQVIDNPGTLQWVPVQQQNGYVAYAQRLVGQTWHWEPADAVLIPGTPGRAGYWDPPGSGPCTVTVYEPHGIWLPEAKGKSFPQLLCPSDPSGDADAEAGRGLVYARSQSPPWGSTNYLANWWALSGDDLSLGWLSPPQSFAAIRDGLSNTVLFAEGYAWCDGTGRIALYPPNQHNFGLTQALPNAQNEVEIDGERVRFGPHERGYPNTWKFQIRPLPRSYDRCPAGGPCCNRWVAQSPHAAMNVALLDGSVRTVSADISRDVWRRALLPRDGEGPGNDW